MMWSHMAEIYILLSEGFLAFVRVLRIFKNFTMIIVHDVIVVWSAQRSNHRVQ